MRLLDLFAGAGGCSVGYHRAGFRVTAVDISPHPDYPFELIVGDAMAVLKDRAFLNRFDAVHALPPCPRYSAITPGANRDEHPDYLPEVRKLLRAWGGAYIIENVPGAPMPQGVMFCGQAMGLPKLRRHRIFESNMLIMSPGCACDAQGTFGVYGDHGDLKPVLRPNGKSRGNKARDVAHAQQLLGIDWMQKWDDLADAIPPAYTEYVGGQILDQLQMAALKRCAKHDTVWMAWLDYRMQPSLLIMRVNDNFREVMFRRQRRFEDWRDTVRQQQSLIDTVCATGTGCSSYEVDLIELAAAA